jgi:hypothetical protein
LGSIKVKQERKSYGLSGVFLGEQSEPSSHYLGVSRRPAKNEGELRATFDWAFDLKGPASSKLSSMSSRIRRRCTTETKANSSELKSFKHLNDIS